MTYQPIENYAIIGDMNTLAQVSINGSSDWRILIPLAYLPLFLMIRKAGISESPLPETLEITC